MQSSFGIFHKYPPYDVHASSENERVYERIEKGDWLLTLVANYGNKRTEVVEGSLCTHMDNQVDLNIVFWLNGYFLQILLHRKCAYKLILNSLQNGLCVLIDMQMF